MKRRTFIKAGVTAAAIAPFGGSAAGECAYRLGPRLEIEFSAKNLVHRDAPAFDKFVAYGTMVWSFGWVAVFVVGSVLGATTGLLTDGFWEKFWWTKLILITGILGTICTVWITIGGCRDAIHLVRDLKKEKIDESDNGFVEGVRHGPAGGEPTKRA
jgi:hypothetical protein